MNASSWYRLPDNFPSLAMFFILNFYWKYLVNKRRRHKWISFCLQNSVLSPDSFTSIKRIVLAYNEKNGENETGRCKRMFAVAERAVNDFYRPRA